MRVTSFPYMQDKKISIYLCCAPGLFKQSHGSNGNFYEGEQEQCRSVPVGALHAGLTISQWHKLCWSRAGVTLAGTNGQLRLSRSFPGPTSNPYLSPAPAYLH